MGSQGPPTSSPGSARAATEGGEQLRLRKMQSGKMTRPRRSAHEQLIKGVGSCNTWLSSMRSWKKPAERRPQPEAAFLELGSSGTGQELGSSSAAANKLSRPSRRCSKARDKRRPPSRATQQRSARWPSSSEVFVRSDGRAGRRSDAKNGMPGDMMNQRRRPEQPA